MDTNDLRRVLDALALLAPTRAERSEFQLLSGGNGSSGDLPLDEVAEQKLVSAPFTLEIQIGTGDSETVEMCLAAVLQSPKAFAHTTPYFVSRLVERRTEASLGQRILKGILEQGMVLDEASLIRLLVEYVDGRTEGTTAELLRRSLAKRCLEDESFSGLLLAAMRTIAKHPQGVVLVERVFPLLRSCFVERPNFCRDLLFETWNPSQRLIVLLEARIAIQAECQRFSERFAGLPEDFLSTTPVLYRAATEALQGLTVTGPYGSERVRWALCLLAQGEPGLVERVLLAARRSLPQGETLNLMPAGISPEYVFG